VRLINIQQAERWLTAAVDSLGNYSVHVLPGKYKIELPDAYLQRSDTIYATAQNRPVTISVVAGNTAAVRGIILPSAPAPDLLPEKGVLHTFSAATPKRSITLSRLT
jgi:hypothetical protein